MKMTLRERLENSVLNRDLIRQMVRLWSDRDSFFEYLNVKRDSDCIVNEIQASEAWYETKSTVQVCRKSIKLDTLNKRSWWSLQSSFPSLRLLYGRRQLFILHDGSFDISPRLFETSTFCCGASLVCCNSAQLYSTLIDQWAISFSSRTLRTVVFYSWNAFSFLANDQQFGR